MAKSLTFPSFVFPVHNQAQQQQLVQEFHQWFTTLPDGDNTLAVEVWGPVSYMYHHFASAYPGDLEKVGGWAKRLQQTWRKHEEESKTLYKDPTWKQMIADNLAVIDMSLSFIEKWFANAEIAPDLTSSR